MAKKRTFKTKAELFQVELKGLEAILTMSVVAQIGMIQMPFHNPFITVPTKRNTVHVFNIDSINDVIKIMNNRKLLTTWTLWWAPSKFCNSLMQILKDVVVKSSTHTEEASCFTPRLSCSADTSTVGTDVNFLWGNMIRGTLKYWVKTVRLIFALRCYPQTAKWIILLGNCQQRDSGFQSEYTDPNFIYWLVENIIYLPVHG